MAGEPGVFETIYNCRAIRYFTPDPVPDELVTRVLDAAIRAPSGSNRQTWHFIVVTDPETREKLKPAAWGQTQVTDASHLVVFAYKKTLTDGDVERFVDRNRVAPVLLGPAANLAGLGRRDFNGRACGAQAFERDLQLGLLEAVGGHDENFGFANVGHGSTPCFETMAPKDRRAHWVN